MLIRKSILLGWFLFAFSLLHPVLGQTKKMYPINEVSKDSSLLIFVEKLKQAIVKKDKAFIVGALDENAGSSFDGGNGILHFQRYWLDKETEPSFWFYLERAIKVGGTFGKENLYFVFPYVYELKPDIEDDDFPFAVVTGEKVNIRAQPNLKAPIIKQLTYEMVRYVHSDEDTTYGKNPIGDPEWIKIQTWDKKIIGWVYYKYLYSPIDCRLF